MEGGHNFREVPSYTANVRTGRALVLLSGLIFALSLSSACSSGDTTTNDQNNQQTTPTPTSTPVIGPTPATNCDNSADFVFESQLGRGDTYCVYGEVTLPADATPNQLIRFEIIYQNGNEIDTLKRTGSATKISYKVTGLGNLDVFKKDLAKYIIHMSIDQNGDSDTSDPNDLDGFYDGSVDAPIRNPGLAKEVVLNGQNWTGINFGIGRIPTPPPPPLPISAQGVYVTGQRAYVISSGSTDYTGLVVFDVQDPAHPTLLGKCPLSGAGNSIYVEGAIAYVIGYGRLEIIDVSDPSSPFLLKNYFPPFADARGVAALGSIVYVADGSAGLLILDAHDPHAPVLVGTFDTPGFAMNVQIVGNIAYVADGESGIEIIDVSNGSSPVLLGSYDTSGYSNNVFVRGSTAFVADGDFLLSLEVSVPSHPILLGSYRSPIAVSYDEVLVSSSTAYAISSSDTFEILDISDASHVAQESNYYFSDSAVSLQKAVIVGTTAYLAAYDAGLSILDVSNPASPALLATYP